MSIYKKKFISYIHLLSVSLYKKTFGVLKDIDICIYILCETALIRLKAEEKDKKFGYKEAWEYINTYLCEEDDFKSCWYFLWGESVLLAQFGSSRSGLANKGHRNSFFCFTTGYNILIKNFIRVLSCLKQMTSPGAMILPLNWNICDPTSKQGIKCACKQVLEQTEKSKINDEAWALNPDKKN